MEGIRARGSRMPRPAFCLSRGDTSSSMESDELSDLHPRLRTYFANRGARQDTLDLVSDVTTRVLVAQRSGQLIESVPGFAFGIARNVWYEYVRRRIAAPDALEHDVEATPVTVEVDPEYVGCLKRCLSHLPPESRRLFIDYVAGAGKNKDRRARLASALGLSPNALQQRVGSLRFALRQCVSTCVQHVAPNPGREGAGEFGGEARP